ncbi:MAG: SsrA-binding protein SmpB [Bacteriovoracaceae bacterium]|nr:SsrA-binding protein SmpB [Bacteriovoracaceae bacterium]
MGIKIIAKHKRASYDYFLKEKFEAGIVLVGTEVKSLRAGKVSIAESHVTIGRDGEVWIHNVNIPHYDFGNINNHEEARRRKLLLHKKEITRIHHKMKTEKLALIPTMIYFKRSYIKIEIALGKGKKLYDKRHDQAQKDVNRKLQRGLYD